MQGSSGPSRKPYSWQSEEIQVKDHTQNYQAKKTQVFTPSQPNPPQLNRPQHSPQMVQPLHPAPLYNQPVAHPQHYAYGHYYCPNCRTQVIPQMVKKIAPAGWIVFAILLVTPLFFLFWLGFFIKEDRMICPICGTRIG